MAAFGTRESEFRDGAGRVGEQAFAIRRICPRLRNDARAVARPDASLVGIDDRVDGRRIDQPLLSEDGFQSLHARGRSAVVSTMIFFSVHPSVLPSCSLRFLRSTWTRGAPNNLPTNRCTPALGCPPICPTAR